MKTFTRGPARALLVLLASGSFACGLLNPQDPGATGDAQEQNLTPQTFSFSCPPGFNRFVAPPPAGALPFVPLQSLQTVANPVLGKDPKTGGPTLRADLGTYVSDVNAAIRLGKAFFWEMQASSDSKVACATCHFSGGSDMRVRNQLNPGANGSFDGKSTNYTLTAADYPFVDPLTSKNIDNSTGSQGQRKATFGGVSSTGSEILTAVNDPIFGTKRQVTSLNAPSTINAVYNHRNFFNGRAQNEFNGLNPWGNRDVGAHIWSADSAGNIQAVDVHITNAPLASQAVAPPLNTVEMSADGRTLPDLGKKLLLLKPLGLQAVNSKDGVLGSLADPKGKGLKTTYASMIQSAFQSTWWSSNQSVTINSQQYTLTQANFSLFWGLAIMLYESTLVADNSPMDQYVASRTFDSAGNLTADNPALLDPVVNRLAAEGITIPLAGGGTRAVTRQDILLGLDLFERPIPAPDVVGIPPKSGVGCNLCHVGAETTAASIRNLTDGVEAGDVAFKNAGFDLRMERMFFGVRNPTPPPPQPPPPVPLGTDGVTYDNGTYQVTVTSMNGTAVTQQTVPVSTYDVGWYDVGVRPTNDDVGLGASDPFSQPLSWTQFFQTTLTNPSTMKIGGGGLICVDANGNPVVPPAAPTSSQFVGEVLDPSTNLPILSGGLLKTEATDVAGSFKTSQLRNVEFGGPYFHNGGKATLRQVIDFYDDGGNFANANLNPLIRPLNLTEDQIDALVAFLVSLTDDRVRLQKAPFDHPELIVPAGEDPNTGADLTTSIPAVGSTGSTAQVGRYLGLNPFQP